MKQIAGGKQTVSNAKEPAKADDPTSTHQFRVTGDAVLYYLRGLANGRLAEVPLPESLAAPISLAECGGAVPLVDLVKLEDTAADHIATLVGRDLCCHDGVGPRSRSRASICVIGAHPDQTRARFVKRRARRESPTRGTDLAMVRLSLRLRLRRRRTVHAGGCRRRATTRTGPGRPDPGRSGGALSSRPIRSRRPGAVVPAIREPGRQVRLGRQRELLQKPPYAYPARPGGLALIRVV